MVLFSRFLRVLNDESRLGAELDDGSQKALGLLAKHLPVDEDGREVCPAFDPGEGINDTGGILNRYRGTLQVSLQLR